MSLGWVPWRWGRNSNRKAGVASETGPGSRSRSNRLIGLCIASMITIDVSYSHDGPIPKRKELESVPEGEASGASFPLTRRTPGRYFLTPPPPPMEPISHRIQPRHHPSTNSMKLHGNDPGALENQIDRGWIDLPGRSFQTGLTFRLRFKELLPVSFQ
jgi:hypothetical protein